jgi:cell filamentation protein
LQQIFDGLTQKQFLRGLGREDFSESLTAVFGALNHVHPFREGNGRTQRLFFEQLARAAGYELNFDVISRERMIRASVDAEQGDQGTLRRLFTDLLDPERYAALRGAVSFLEPLDKSQFDWNKAYIAHTVLGNITPVCCLAGKAEEVRHQLIVGRQSDIPANIKNGERLAFTAGGDIEHGRTRGGDRQH